MAILTQLRQPYTLLVMIKYNLLILLKYKTRLFRADLYCEQSLSTPSNTFFVDYTKNYSNASSFSNSVHLGAVNSLQFYAYKADAQKFTRHREIKGGIDPPIVSIKVDKMSIF